jgi:hypothetical protein
LVAGGLIRGKGGLTACLEASTLPMEKLLRYRRQAGDFGDMTFRAMGSVIAGLLLLSTTAMAAEQPAALISSYRLKHGEVRVVRDVTLDRIAQEQARAMAAKDTLSHEVLGSFSRRVAPARAGRAAENIAYGYESFDKTLGQWIDSSEHRKNLLLHNASRVGIASAKDASGKRTYWAMVIAGDYEPKPPKGRKDREPLVAVRRDVTPAAKPKSSDCHIKLLSLCI